MKAEMLLTLSGVLVASLCVCGCSMGKMAANNWDGKQYSLLEGHWGAATEKQQGENGAFNAIFRAGSDCTATFNVNPDGIIVSHQIVGGSCSFDAYNRLKNVEH